MNVLQQNNTTNTNDRREIIIIRKPQILPNNKDDILLTNTAKKKSKAVRDVKYATNPPPIAVARRNARERNRVKQVNNGFATLRQHIPNSIAAAFESNTGRGGNKKLSKVETLRMAVEYIRSLEDILASDEIDSNISTHISSLSQNLIIATPASTTQTTTYVYPIISPSLEDDDLSSTNPTPPPTSTHQYIKVNNAYQIIPMMNINDNLLTDPSIIDTTDLEFSDVQDLSLLNSMQTSGSLSPEVYSESSLSPHSVMDKNDAVNNYISIYNGRSVSPQQIDVKFKVEPPSITMHEDDEIPEEHKENMIHVMAWWEEQQKQQMQSS